VYFQAGRRHLPDAWSPVDDQAVLGCEAWNPLDLREMWGISIAYSDSKSRDGNNRSEVQEFSLGLDRIWQPHWYPFEGNGVFVYAGGGYGKTDAELVLAGLPRTASAGAGFVHGGIVFSGQGPVYFGAEVRYTFGARLEDLGADLSADGLQLLFLITVDPLYWM
jgi:hypothetical protein